MSTLTTKITSSSPLAPSSSLSTTRIRKRPISFGNPALGTYHGIAYTLEDNNINDNYNNNNNNSYNNTGNEINNKIRWPLIEGAEMVDQMVAIVEVPPEQVPEGILNLARYHRTFINHVRIVIADPHSQTLDNNNDKNNNNNNSKDESTDNERRNASYQGLKVLQEKFESDDINVIASSNDFTISATVDGIHPSPNDSTTSLLPPISATAMENAASILAQDEELENSKHLENLEQQEQTQQQQQMLWSSMKSENGDKNVVNSNNDDNTTNTLSQLSNFHNQQQEEPPQRTYLVLVEMVNDQAAESFVQDLHGKPYTSLDETQTCSIYHVVALKGHNGVSLMSPFFAPSTKSSNKGIEILPSSSLESSDEPSSSTSTTTTNTATGTTVAATTTATTSATDNTNTAVSVPSTPHLEDHNCAVCLEHMVLDHRRRYFGGPASMNNNSNGDNSNANSKTSAILTTVCNHTFHLDCLLRWQDSPCPVCRYDHSGLNEALSQCHICGTTEHNYVCLICGVVSCGQGASRTAVLPTCAVSPTATLAVASVSTTTKDADCCASALTATNNNSNVSSSATNAAAASRNHARLLTSHARKHYDETLHAYALDTDTQHVWDFAGQGYVHRLLQNKEDGKLVEVHDPNNTTSQERSLNPGLSDAQEGEVVHRKLEGFASQYYTLLKSQLEQQRTFYEGRLEEIRREYSLKANQIQPAQDLISALRQERKQLTQRLLTVNRKNERVTDDVAFLKNMNESLESNKINLKRKVMEAQQERIAAREMIQNTLPPLEEKLTMLMLQLEESESNTNTKQQECAPMDNKKPSAAATAARTASPKR